MTQLDENAFNLTPQTLKSVQPSANYGAQKKTPRLLIYGRCGGNRQHLCRLTPYIYDVKIY
jgi:hypothetical protein